MSKTNKASTSGLGLLILLVAIGAVEAQEVIIRGFPLGAGESVDRQFFKPYLPQLEALAESLNVDPLAEIVVRGSRDAVRYRAGHDAKNAGLSVGRADLVEKILVQRLNADSNRISIETMKEDEEGQEFRYVSVRVVHRFGGLSARLDSLQKQLDSLRNRPLGQQPGAHPLVSDLVIEMTAGLSTTPFGVVPTGTGAFVYKRWLYIQGIVGHTWWDSRSSFAGRRLYTWHRLAGAMITVYPRFSGPVGLSAGWLRHEDISQAYYRYVRMTEGPVLGARVSPYPRVLIGAYYHPLKKVYGTDRANIRWNQFLVSLSYQLIGGGK
ncbi:MAG: hypothetical protein A2W25_16135 [candidate division Zixibacteria bacterium RBG_16_53_22]|nr:MAG: hypothetical protein A2W25_16135 [candidate division Zixibacteria bacterium RBG_16_53_22]